jgi:hypothetical protein
LVYHMIRLVQLIKRDMKTVKQGLMDSHSEAAPVVL